MKSKQVKRRKKIGINLKKIEDVVGGDKGLFITFLNLLLLADENGEVKIGY